MSHPGQGLAGANERLELTGRRRQGSVVSGSDLSKLQIALKELFLRGVAQARVDGGPCVIDVVPQQGGVQGGLTSGGGLLVEADQVPREPAVRVGGCIVEDQVDEIKPAEEGRGQAEIFHHTPAGVISRLRGVRRGQDRGPGAQARYYPGLRNRDGLLLHGLVQDRPRRIRHLIELVDAADSLVREDQCPGL
ncbi:unnamed protein product [Pseudo-nitzschia multistriata]|uniref:Uncharacterized protein n=1 Tax=Pseudo-nitzschia multistriata TaxID=183589 RepID=A0A448ZG01_9STRA|nr:unnamed protein product [Pseudo-nitzschia multistriata]